MKGILVWLKNNKKTTLVLFIVFIGAIIGFRIRSNINSIKTEELKIGDLSAAIYGSAQLKTENSFDLKLGTSARITEIRKSIGQKVKKGEKLLSFDNLPDFVSPIDGTVTAINFKVGETAFAQATVLSIVNPKNFYLEMTLDQKSVRYVKEGQKARISLDGYRDLKIDGVVRSRYSNNGIFYAIIDLAQADPSFLSGMSADVAVITEIKKDVLLAPLGSLKDGKLLLKTNRGPREISVSVGIDDGYFAEVTSDKLKSGDTAIIRSSFTGMIPPTRD